MRKLGNKLNTQEALMDFITYVGERMKEELPSIIEGYEGRVSADSLSEMETAVRTMTHTLGNEVMQRWLEAQEEKYPAREQGCECGEKAGYVRRRQGMAITLQGRVYYRRAYYLCGACQRGHYPLDQRLGIEAGQMSEEVVKQAALVGIQDAFGAARQTLAELTLLELSPTSIHKASLSMGERVLAAEEQLKTRSQNLDSQLEQRRSEAKPVRLYGSMDGFMVPLEDGWHEMKSGLWWTTVQRKDGTLAARQMSYYVDLLPAEAFADLVWATGFERLADQAHELIFVADGADWIWRIVQRHYPQAIQIVDWYHACHYLAPVAEVAFSDPQLRADWLEHTRTALWEGRLDDVLAACQPWVNPHRPDDPAQKAITFYTNNHHRMDYAVYRARGYMIGSGSMESGCKQIGLERLKIAGARWTPDGARKVAKARAAYLSGQWHSLAPLSQAA
jgi:hypothetical protein